MKYIELQAAFELEINRLDDGLHKVMSSDIEYFLNSALDKFWKTRYSQNNPKLDGFEQSQKRIDDLRTLVTECNYSELSELNMQKVAKTSNSLYTVILPDDYIILLGDTAGITPADGIVDPCWESDEEGNYVIHYSDTIEGQIETIDRIKENSLSEFHRKYTKAKPIRLMAGNQIKLYTDGTYKVSRYTIQYLRRPQYIDIHKDPFKEYTDMPEHTHLEIVKLAAQLYIENQANPRYDSYTQEVIPNME